MPHVIYLTPEEAAGVLGKTVTGDGGLQRLQRAVRASLFRRGAGYELVVHDLAMCERLVRYVDRYGGGGFQNRLRPIAERVRHLVPPAPTQGTLF